MGRPKIDHTEDVSAKQNHLCQTGENSLGIGQERLENDHFRRANALGLARLPKVFRAAINIKQSLVRQWHVSRPFAQYQPKQPNEHVGQLDLLRFVCRNSCLSRCGKGKHQ